MCVVMIVLVPFAHTTLPRCLLPVQFKPEFLNRIDEFVIFNSLGKEALREIVKLEVLRLEKRLSERQITMTLTNEALDHLADVGFDPIYGARPLKRTIQRQLETTVAQGILRGDYKDGDNILVSLVNGQLDVRQAMNAAAFQ